MPKQVDALLADRAEIIEASLDKIGAHLGFALEERVRPEIRSVLYAEARRLYMIVRAAKIAGLQVLDSTEPLVLIEALYDVEREIEAVTKKPCPPFYQFAG